MIREWVTKLSKSVNQRAISRRRELHVPIKITIAPDRNTGSLQKPVKELSIKGETKDLSLTGVAFIVSSIRLNEYYLVGDRRILNAEINLPNGKVKMQIEGERYEQIGNQHLSISEYVVGAKIVSISVTDKATYEEFIRGKKQQTGTLELGIDESKA